MRFGLILLVLIFAATGAVFGALNSGPVAIDLYFCVVHLPLGVALLVGLFCGWVIGGLVVYFGLVLRLRARIAAMQRANKTPSKALTVSAPKSAGDANA